MSRNAREMDAFSEGRIDREVPIDSPQGLLVQSAVNPLPLLPHGAGKTDDSAASIAGALRDGGGFMTPRGTNFQYHRQHTPLRLAVANQGQLSMRLMDKPRSGIARSATTPFGFAVKFILCFALLFGAFEASRGSAFERFVVEDMILVPTTALINIGTPNEHATLVGRVISSPESHLNVTRGCEGIEMFLLLVAGIVAFPAGWKQRLQGLLFGSLLAYFLSVTRLMALHYILHYSPDAWEALHGMVLPLGPIILIGLFFLRWSSGATLTPLKPSTSAA